MTPILPVSASEEELGDDDEDVARLVSAHFARAAAEVPRTDLLSAVVLHLQHPLLPFLCLFFTDGARQLFRFGLGPIQPLDVRFAVVHLGGVCISFVRRVARP